MIAIILAGGYGIRLYPLTINVPKALLPVGERTISDLICEKLGNLEDLSEIAITTNRNFEPQFREWLNKKPYRNVRVIAEESHSEIDKLGATRALAKLTEKVHAEDYLIVGGDNLFTSELEEFVRYYREKKCPLIAVYDIGDPTVARDFSVVRIDSEGKITGFEEKPDEPISTLIGTCIYILPAQTLMRVHEYLTDGGNPDSPGYFMEWLSKSESVYGYKIPGEWWDIGTPKSYEKARSSLSGKDCEVLSGKGSTDPLTLREPSHHAGSRPILIYYDQQF